MSVLDLNERREELQIIAVETNKSTSQNFNQRNIGWHDGTFGFDELQQAFHKIEQKYPSKTMPC